MRDDIREIAYRLDRISREDPRGVFSIIQTMLRWLTLNESEKALLKEVRGRIIYIYGENVQK